MGYVRSRTAERIVTWEMFFLERGGENTSKYANFVFGPDTPRTDYFGLPFSLENVPILHSRGLENAPKRSQ